MPEEMPAGVRADKIRTSEEADKLSVPVAAKARAMASNRAWVGAAEAAGTSVVAPLAGGETGDGAGMIAKSFVQIDVMHFAAVYTSTASDRIYLIYRSVFNFDEVLNDEKPVLSFITRGEGWLTNWTIDRTVDEAVNW